jgi:hypothetical protein
MGLHCPFGHLKHKLLPKEGSRVKLAIWLPTTKSWENWLDFRACRWHATYSWKALDEGYNFALDLISIGGLHAKLWCPKILGVPILAILGLPLGSLKTKCHFDVSLVGNHRVYYKGEGGAFPQVRVVVSLVSPSLPVARPSTKSALTMY